MNQTSIQHGLPLRRIIVPRPSIQPANHIHLRWSSSAIRQRRDNLWIPTVSLKKHDGVPEATDLLVQAGYLRQAYSGIYHMLPLGLIVQSKLEKLIDKHMGSIQASKVSLSSITSQKLWQKSGRLSSGSEFFKFADRKDAKWLLAPTHEEEITQLVAELVNAPGQLPVRLYQVTRKYRDEKRPRGGLLRGREFIMKDLYTFDATQAEAHFTYDQVRAAYRNFLADLKVPYVEARADSGNMGGSLSHEYHFPSIAGEDDVIHCNTCDHARNEEWVPDCPHSVSTDFPATIRGETKSMVDIFSESYINSSHTILVKAFAPRSADRSSASAFNAYAVKAALSGIADLDSGVEEVEMAFLAKNIDISAGRKMVYYLFDPSIKPASRCSIIDQDMAWREQNSLDHRLLSPLFGPEKPFSLLKQKTGDPCPSCKTGTLQVDKAIEVGHTFHLGTRYSSKLNLTVRNPQKGSEAVPVQMGCHGIGISRLIAAVASAISDSTGLNWPASIAPYHAVIVVDGNDGEKKAIAETIYDAMRGATSDGIDVLLDDRTSVSNGYKLKDADLIGYPVILVVGKTWQQTGRVEIQCRRLKVKENVNIEEVPSFVADIVQQL